MIKNLLCCFILISLSRYAYSQKENNNWYFGKYAGIDFNPGSPVFVPNGQINTLEGCSSISDANGNLLFYTDGIHVWDKTHTQMPNGFGLLSNSSSTQAALIVPLPLSTTLYYIFTTGVLGSDNFCYSVVDMSLNGGNGDITTKNVLVTSTITERQTAVRHANNADVWIAIQRKGSTEMLAYQLTPAGLNLTPVISNVGEFMLGTSVQGQMKFSPDGLKLALNAQDIANALLYDFDPSTGIISNKKHLFMPPSIYYYGYGIEFSPSGSYLYATDLTDGLIYQWDITSNSEATINATFDSVGFSTGSSVSGLQLGPDGKIYVAKNNSEYLGVINSPEMPGLLCNYVDSAILLGTGTSLSKYGLPGFVTSYFLNTGIDDTDLPLGGASIFPNPASEYFNITHDLSEDVILEIYSPTGQLVFQMQYDHSNPVRVSIHHLPKGFYIVKLKSKKDFMQVKALMKY